MSLNADNIKTLKAYLLAGFAGAIAPLSLSPVDFWPLALVSVFLLLLLLENTGSRQAAWLGWCYGLGFFGLGASWVYVSINVYGNASGMFAAFLTLIFVAGLALLFTLQCWLYQRYFAGIYRAFGFAACWVLFEWLRSWLLTGFPWLYLGYAHNDTWLAGLAPVLGVMGISFAVVLISGLLFDLYQFRIHQKTIKVRHFALTLLLFTLLGVGPLSLHNIDWVSRIPNRDAEVALVQANIDQDLKFDPAYISEGLNLYMGLSDPLWDADIVIWPETAIPLIYQRAEAELAYFDQLARESSSSLVSGILYREDRRIFNSITALGNGEGVYHKQKLVPFGEYVPLSGLMDPLLQIFNLPMSSLSAGPANQPLLQASGYQLAAYICYEVVYPDFVRKQAYQADFLVTISNDTWFGASFGPLQHLQMAAMRALENGRYMVRATSNGVTAFINEKGQIISQTEQFEIATLSSIVPAFSGRTPFSYWGSLPIVLFSLFVLGLISFIKFRKRKPF
tara:strand:- start:98954 stop:100474 length:1521 start_codon:yes stop_codon:yes gene_type:complete